jgi:hypothetical protein
MQHELHVAQWSDVLTHDFLLRIDWMAAPAAEYGFTLSRFPDARPRVDFSHANVYVCFKQSFE